MENKNNDKPEKEYERDEPIKWDDFNLDEEIDYTKVPEYLREAEEVTSSILESDIEFGFEDEREEESDEVTFGFEDDSHDEDNLIFGHGGSGSENDSDEGDLTAEERLQLSKYKIPREIRDTYDTDSFDMEEMVQFLTENPNITSLSSAREYIQSNLRFASTKENILLTAENIGETLSDTDSETESTVSVSDISESEITELEVPESSPEPGLFTYKGAGQGAEKKVPIDVENYLINRLKQIKKFDQADREYSAQDFIELLRRLDTCLSLYSEFNSVYSSGDNELASKFYSEFKHSAASLADSCVANIFSSEDIEEEGEIDGLNPDIMIKKEGRIIIIDTNTSRHFRRFLNHYKSYGEIPSDASESFKRKFRRYSSSEGHDYMVIFDKEFISDIDFIGQKENIKIREKIVNRVWDRVTSVIRALEYIHSVTFENQFYKIKTLTREDKRDRNARLRNLKTSIKNKINQVEKDFLNYYKCPDNMLREKMVKDLNEEYLKLFINSVENSKNASKYYMPQVPNESSTIASEKEDEESHQTSGVGKTLVSDKAQPSFNIPNVHHKPLFKEIDGDFESSSKHIITVLEESGAVKSIENSETKFYLQKIVMETLVSRLSKIKEDPTILEQDNELMKTEYDTWLKTQTYKKEGIDTQMSFEIYSKMSPKKKQHWMSKYYKTAEIHRGGLFSLHGVKKGLRASMAILAGIGIKKYVMNRYKRKKKLIKEGGVVGVDLDNTPFDKVSTELRKKYENKEDEILNQRNQNTFLFYRNKLNEWIEIDKIFKSGGMSREDYEKKTKYIIGFDLQSEIDEFESKEKGGSKKEIKDLRRRARLENKFNKPKGTAKVDNQPGVGGEYRRRFLNNLNICFLYKENDDNRFILTNTKQNIRLLKEGNNRIPRTDGIYSGVKYEFIDIKELTKRSYNSSKIKILRIDREHAKSFEETTHSIMMAETDRDWFDKHEVRKIREYKGETSNMKLRKKVVTEEMNRIMSTFDKLYYNFYLKVVENMVKKMTFSDQMVFDQKVIQVVSVCPNLICVIFARHILNSSSATTPCFFAGLCEKDHKFLDLGTDNIRRIDIRDDKQLFITGVMRFDASRLLYLSTVFHKCNANIFMRMKRAWDQDLSTAELLNERRGRIMPVLYAALVQRQDFHIFLSLMSNLMYNSIQDFNLNDELIRQRFKRHIKSHAAEMLLYKLYDIALKYPKFKEVIGKNTLQALTARKRNKPPPPSNVDFNPMPNLNGEQTTDLQFTKVAFEDFKAKSEEDEAETKLEEHDRVLFKIENVWGGYMYNLSDFLDNMKLIPLSNKAMLPNQQGMKKEIDKFLKINASREFLLKNNPNQVNGNPFVRDISHMMPFDSNVKGGEYCYSHWIAEISSKTFAEYMKRKGMSGFTVNKELFDNVIAFATQKSSIEDPLRFFTNDARGTTQTAAMKLFFHQNCQIVIDCIEGIIDNNIKPVIDLVIKIQSGDKRYFGVLLYVWRLYNKVSEDFYKTLLKTTKIDIIATRGEDKIHKAYQDWLELRSAYIEYSKNNPKLDIFLESIDATGFSPTSHMLEFAIFEKYMDEISDELSHNFRKLGYLMWNDKTVFVPQFFRYKMFNNQTSDAYPVALNDVVEFIQGQFSFVATAKTIAGDLVANKLTYLYYRAKDLEEKGVNFIEWAKIHKKKLFYELDEVWETLGIKDKIYKLVKKHSDDGQQGTVCEKAEYKNIQFFSSICQTGNNIIRNDKKTVTSTLIVEILSQYIYSSSVYFPMTTFVSVIFSNLPSQGYRTDYVSGLSRISENFRKGLDTVSSYFILKLLNEWISSFYGLKDVTDITEENEDKMLRKKNVIVGSNGEILNRIDLPIELGGICDALATELLENVSFHDHMVRLSKKSIESPEYKYVLVNTQINLIWADRKEVTYTEEELDKDATKHINFELRKNQRGKEKQSTMIRTTATSSFDFKNVIENKGHVELKKGKYVVAPPKLTGKEELNKEFKTFLEYSNKFGLITAVKSRDNHLLIIGNMLDKMYNRNYALSLSSTNAVIQAMRLGFFSKGKSCSIYISKIGEREVIKRYDEFIRTSYGERTEAERNLDLVYILDKTTEDDKLKERISMLEIQAERKDYEGSTSFKKRKNKTVFKLICRGNNVRLLNNAETFKEDLEVLKISKEEFIEKSNLQLRGKFSLIVSFMNYCFGPMYEKSIKGEIEHIARETRTTLISLSMESDDIISTLARKYKIGGNAIPWVNHSNYKTLNIVNVIDSCYEIYSVTNNKTSSAQMMKELRTNIDTFRIRNKPGAIVMNLIFKKGRKCLKKSYDKKYKLSPKQQHICDEYTKYKREGLDNILLQSVGKIDYQYLTQEMRFAQEIAGGAIWFRDFQDVYRILTQLLSNTSRSKKYILTNNNVPANIIFFYTGMYENKTLSRKLKMTVNSFKPIYGPDGEKRYIQLPSGEALDVARVCTRTVLRIFSSLIHTISKSSKYEREDGVHSKEITRIALDRTIKIAEHLILKETDNHFSKRTLMDYIKGLDFNSVKIKDGTVFSSYVVCQMVMERYNQPKSQREQGEDISYVLTIGLINKNFPISCNYIVKNTDRPEMPFKAECNFYGSKFRIEKEYGFEKPYIMYTDAKRPWTLENQYRLYLGVTGQVQGGVSKAIVEILQRKYKERERIAIRERRISQRLKGIIPEKINENGFRFLKRGSDIPSYINKEGIVLFNSDTFCKSRIHSNSLFLPNVVFERKTIVDPRALHQPISNASIDLRKMRISFDKARTKSIPLLAPLHEEKTYSYYVEDFDIITEEGWDLKALLELEELARELSRERIGDLLYLIYSTIPNTDYRFMNVRWDEVKLDRVNLSMFFNKYNKKEQVSELQIRTSNLISPFAKSVILHFLKVMKTTEREVLFKYMMLYFVTCMNVCDNFDRTREFFSLFIIIVKILEFDDVLKVKGPRKTSEIIDLLSLMKIKPTTTIKITSGGFAKIIDITEIKDPLNEAEEILLNIEKTLDNVESNVTTKITEDFKIREGVINVDTIKNIKGYGSALNQNLQFEITNNLKILNGLGERMEHLKEFLPDLEKVFGFLDIHIYNTLKRILSYSEETELKINSFKSRRSSIEFRIRFLSEIYKNFIVKNGAVVVKSIFELIKNGDQVQNEDEELLKLIESIKRKVS